jgi:hypothetical protein
MGKSDSLYFQIGDRHSRISSQWELKMSKKPGENPAHGRTLLVWASKGYHREGVMLKQTARVAQTSYDVT